MKTGWRVVAASVATDPIFQEESREMLLSARVRAVQSTPLIDRSGKLIGIVSTHYDRPESLTSKALKDIDNVAASCMARLESSGMVSM